MHRRFLNLVSHSLFTRFYSLYRINISKNLFYECTADAQAKTKGRGLLRKIKSSLLLPKPEIIFRGAQTSENRGRDYWFSLLGGGDSRILFADNGCQTALYNADLKGIAPMPNAHSRKGRNPIRLSMPQADRTGSHSLFVMDKSRDTCFEVLARTRTDPCRSLKDWCWHTLPRPPFRFDPALEVSAGMCPHSVVDSRTICVSSSLKQNIGSTYMYDTVSSVWTKAGNWVLPFFGKAEYVPELNLWFGLTACKPSYRLCAFDLSAIKCKQPPRLQHTWDVLALPDERSPSHVHLVNLGLGRFCIATFFGPLFDEQGDILEDQFVVLTGIDIKRNLNDEATLLMTEHMSKYVNLGKANIEYMF